MGKLSLFIKNLSIYSDLGEETMSALLKNTLIAAVVCSILLTMFSLFALGQATAFLFITITAVIGATIAIVAVLSLEIDG